MKKFIILTTLCTSLFLVGCASETKSTDTTSITPTQTYSLQNVQAHATSTWCRSVVRNNVYDFTTWISKHPGWPEKILGICGKDATPIFEKVHGGKEKPEMMLKKFIIWTLK